MPWTAAISAAGAALGGLFGGGGAAMSGKDYLKGVRETNEQNYKIWQEQQQHNVDMFNLENDAAVRNWQNQFDQTNAYNTASAQRQRLEEAGLNPTLMMNGGSAGTASSSGIPSASAHPAQAPQMQAPQQVQSPWTALADGALAGLERVSQSLGVHSEMNERDSLLPWKQAMLKEDLAGLKLRNQFDRETYKTRRDAVYYQTEDLRLKNDLDAEKIKLVRAQIGVTNLDAATKEVALKYFDERQLLEIEQSVADIMLKYEQGKLTAEQVKTQIAMTAQTWANVAHLNMQTALGWQQYSFNKEMNPLLLAGQEQSNLATFKDNQQKDINRWISKSLMPDIITAQGWKYKFDTFNYKSKYRMAGGSDGEPNFIYNTLTGFDFMTTPFKGLFKF